MTVYYARCTSIYRTPQSQRDIETLRRLCLDVVDPSLPEFDAMYRTEGMAGFERVVRACDAFAFRALPDGRIPAGVAHELKVAREVGMPIIELPSRTLGRTITVEETREYLREVGER